MTRIDVTQSVVRELLHYNRKTGQLIWKHRKRKWFKTDGRCSQNGWNARWVGKPALNSLNHDGYRAGAILGQAFLAQRIIWLWMTGAWPKNEIDHENRNRADNRWCNLRDVSHAINSRNCLRSNNNTGISGVTKTKENTFEVCISVRGRCTYLGRFKTLSEAIEVRRTAEKKHYKEKGTRNDRPFKIGHGRNNG